MRALLITAAITLGLTAGLAPSAYAGRLVHDDARRDVVKLTFDQEVKESIARKRLDPDIRRITIDYRQGALVIRTKYAALERLVGRGEATLIQAGSKAYFAQVQVNRRGRWQGSKVFLALDTDDQNACPAAKHRFDYDADVSIWTIPPVCVGRARWVTVAQSASYIGGQTAFVDYAFAEGMPGRTRFSARVWRG